MHITIYREHIYNVPVPEMMLVRASVKYVPAASILFCVALPGPCLAIFSKYFPVPVFSVSARCSLIFHSPVSISTRISALFTRSERERRTDRCFCPNSFARPSPCLPGPACVPLSIAPLLLATHARRFVHPRGSGCGGGGRQGRRRNPSSQLRLLSPFCFCRRRRSHA